LRDVGVQGVLTGSVRVIVERLVGWEGEGEKGKRRGKVMGPASAFWSVFGNLARRSFAGWLSPLMEMWHAYLRRVAS